MARGLGNLPEGGGSGSGLRHLWLKDDGETARIRFLTDGDEIYWDWFHRIEERGQYRGERICVRSALDEPCNYCDEEVKSIFQWIAWVYVEYVDYASPGQGRKPVTIGRTKMYREHMNEARLLRLAGAHANSVKMRFEKLGTLLDHEFDWTRSGPKGTNRPQYTLDPVEKCKMPKELRELLAELDDLEDIAFDRVKKIEKSDRKRTVEPSRPSKRPRDEDEDDEDPFGAQAKKKPARVEPEEDDENEEETPNKRGKVPADYDDEEAEAPKKKQRREEPEDDDEDSPF